MIGVLLAAIASLAEADNGSDRLPIIVLLIVVALLALGAVLVLVRRARKTALSASLQRQPESRER